MTLRPIQNSERIEELFAEAYRERKDITAVQNVFRRVLYVAADRYMHNERGLAFFIRDVRKEQEANHRDE